MLTNEKIRTFLSKALFGESELYKQYIIPLQGNWYNPVDDNGKAATWVGFHIIHISGEVRPIMVGNQIDTFCECLLHLQFIGPQALECAQSVLNWNMRSDISKMLLDMFGGHLLCDKRRIKSSPYNQDGMNNTLLYALEIKFIFNNQEKPEMPILTGAELSGNLIIGG